VNLELLGKARGTLGCILRRDRRGQRKRRRKKRVEIRKEEKTGL